MSREIAKKILPHDGYIFFYTKRHPLVKILLVWVWFSFLSPLSFLGVATQFGSSVSAFIIVVTFSLDSGCVIFAMF